MLLGDVVHCPAELLSDDWEMIGDVDRQLAQRSREALAKSSKVRTFRRLRRTSRDCNLVGFSGPRAVDSGRLAEPAGPSRLGRRSIALRTSERRRSASPIRVGH